MTATEQVPLEQTESRPAQPRPRKDWVLNPLVRDPLIAAGLLRPAAHAMSFDGPSPQGWTTERDDNPERVRLVTDTGPEVFTLGKSRPEWRRPWPTLKLDWETRSNVLMRVGAERNGNVRPIRVDGAYVGGGGAIERMRR